jgi:hypothetical protein
MPTVGEMVEKISELRSRKATVVQIAMYLRAHYLSSDSGAAEMKITRDDYHVVPEDHIRMFIDDLAQLADESDAMCAEFESFLANDPTEIEEAVRGKKGKGNGTTRKREDQSAAKDSGSQGDG